LALPGHQPEKIRFGPFELVVADRVLRESDKPIKLQPQQFDVLAILVECAGRVVSREEIRKRIWDPDTFVDFERSINFAINQIRAALKDDPDNPRFIETVPKRGYRFIAPIELDSRGPHSPARDPISIDRRPSASAHPHTFPIQENWEEPSALIQTIPDDAPVQVTSVLRRNPGRLILGGVVVVTLLAVVWSMRNRSTARAGITVQQLTHNSTDNPITSVVVSPDGKYFAYSDLGGLHVKLLQTGEIRDFAQPGELGEARAQWVIRWFPDSARFLAVAWGLGVPPSTWQASVLGGSMRLVERGTVAWSVSPDGSQFAFTKEDERVLWISDLEGKKPRKMADAGVKNWFSHLEWSPDGSHLLYIKRVPTAGGLQNSMEIQDVEKGATTTLLSDDSMASLIWLHDGRILYVEHESGAKGDVCHYILRGLNNAYTSFSTAPQELTQDNGACISSISATADSKRLYFLKQRMEFGIYVADLAPDATRISPPTHFTQTDNREFPTTWTADGRDIVFVSRREDKWGFYRQTLGSKSATPILTGLTDGLGAIFPSISPDGAWLLYAPFSAGQLPEDKIDVFRVPISGGPPQRVMSSRMYDILRCARAPSTFCVTAAKDNDQLTFTAFDPVSVRRQELARFKVDEPDKRYGWDISPDGTRIIVLKRGGSEFHVLSLRTHEDRKVVVKGWSGLEALEWASDGKGFFTSSRATDVVLLHLDLQGNAHVLWEPKGDNMVWAVPSADGHHVAMPSFAFNSNIWSMQDF